MPSITLPMRAWYGDDRVSFPLPEEWDVRVVDLQDRPVLTDGHIARAFASPIGTPRIADLARGKRSAAILVEDLSRPAPTARMLPPLLAELKAGGIADDDILIIIAAGSHEFMYRDGLVKKLGAEVVTRYDVMCHDCGANLACLGESSHGTSIYINKFALECDLRIGVGGIYPHGYLGFGGGSKIVLPAIAGRDSIAFLHSRLKAGGLGNLENEQRADSEEVARKVGLHAIVNAVINTRREIVGLFVGDMIAAHREGCAFARAAYAVTPVPDPDLVIANAYPMDTNLQQTGKGAWPFETVRAGGTKILVTASTEGTGQHRVSLRGRSRISPEAAVGTCDFAVFSPIVGPREIHAIFPDSLTFTTWDGVLDLLRSRYRSPQVRVAVYPCAPIQMPVTE
ncbi:MAG: DUF2088 domain-containing protein [Candidatus Latescibacteria bacterium]|nr:DUF2088 domain-containing protein [Candidatus Latescibacterota bacterium]